ncbi:hypothetical protein SAMN03159379_05320 [Variovorax sp. NFACC26]|nr:hypothetical protein SAMN03159379_05320 [Variovorax sp. NFACC26]
MFRRRQCGLRVLLDDRVIYDVACLAESLQPGSVPVPFEDVAGSSKQVLVTGLPTTSKDMGDMRFEQKARVHVEQAWIFELVFEHAGGRIDGVQWMLLKLSPEGSHNVVYVLLGGGTRRRAWNIFRWKCSFRGFGRLW